ncbi:hypothetical protein EDC04DRAFT_2609058 [Pisolithus marmoratus]|nr:hypothetical protein EDC04DRAFT_2609058 [Pisolithus marmoratus]
MELLDEDVVPIHRQQFPLMMATPDSDNYGGASVAATVSERQEHENFLTTVGSIVPERQEQKIRNLDTVVGCYSTSHELLLPHPPPCPHAKSGDLYIHRYDGNRRIQIWVRDEGCWIADVADGHHHPVLSGYRLYVTDGLGPTWVTKKTRSTYKGRDRMSSFLYYHVLITHNPITNTWNMASFVSRLAEK